MNEFIERKAHPFYLFYLYPILEYSFDELKIMCNRAIRGEGIIHYR